MISFGNEARDMRETARTPAAPTQAHASQPSSSSPFSQTSSSHNATPTATSQSKVAVLGPTLRFKGELSAEEDFVLQGSLEGSISNPQCVTVGTDGTVVGDIRARIITVDGQVEGDLHGGESVVVHQTGRVTGNIYAPRVGIVEGAYFNGRIEMVQRAATATVAPKPAQPTARVPSQIAPGAVLSPEETEKVLTKR